MKQEWNAYTEEDHAVWKILFERQVNNLRDKAWSNYLECVSKAGLQPERVPDFHLVEKALDEHTGWKIEVVPGIIPVTEFLGLLHRKKFCSSTWLRSRAQLDYLEEPDMFHDIFGHIPLLADKAYADFVERFAALGIRFAQNEKALLLLERLYWFTIEFGLVQENGKLKILGAGLLSSFGETNHVFSGKVELKPFSVPGVLSQAFRNDQVQNLYFVLDNIYDLWNCLPEVEGLLIEC